MSLIMSAKKELFMAAQAFDSRPVAIALGEARDRGVDVRLVIDHTQAEAQEGYKAIDYLLSKDIPVIRCANYSGMQHRFIVVDGKHIELGSFGYTEADNTRNASAAIVLRNTAHLADVFRIEWLRLAAEPKVSPEQIMAVDAGLAVLRELGI